MRHRLSVLVLWVPLAGCGGAAQPPAAPPTAEPPPGTSVSRSGTLRHDAIEPGRKSAEAYLGREFLVVTDGVELLVEPKDQAMRDRLVALAGRRVHVECVVREAAMPDPMSSYPMGADGAPLPRPHPCTLETLRAE